LNGGGLGKLTVRATQTAGVFVARGASKPLTAGHRVERAMPHKPYRQLPPGKRMVYTVRFFYFSPLNNTAKGVIFNGGQTCVKIKDLKYGFFRM